VRALQTTRLAVWGAAEDIRKVLAFARGGGTAPPEDDSERRASMAAFGIPESWYEDQPAT